MKKTAASASSSEKFQQFLAFMDGINPLSLERDPDGASFGTGAVNVLMGMSGSSAIDSMTRDELRVECWRQYHKSPFIKTAIDDAVGALTGDGFGISSREKALSEIIKKTQTDFRNELILRWSQFVTGRMVTGEGFIVFTVHDDGEALVEVDFLSPGAVTGAGEDNTGILFHPNKTRMPLIYNVKTDLGKEQIPSINLAYLPSLIEVAKKVQGFEIGSMKNSRSTKPGFDKLGGFKRFIVEWEGPTLSRRDTSYLRSVIIWSNLYTLLKLVEIDHKRSLASFLWVASPETEDAWDLFQSLTPDQQKQTGLFGPKIPGGTLITPPGWKMDAKSPQLPNISESDTDILEFIISGLNTPEDAVTGKSKGTYASVKESRGPWGDRVKNSQHYFRLFQLHRFWKSIFFLHQKVFGLAPTFRKKEVVDFKNGKPVTGFVNREPWELVDISFPVFGSGDFEGTVKAHLGVKHQGLKPGMGISNQTVAGRLGIANYHAERLLSATEDLAYPELQPAIDSEKQQDDKLEPPAGGKKDQG